MHVLILLFLLAAVLIFGTIWLIYSMIRSKIMLFLGYKQYELTKILSFGGFKVDFVWKKTDNEVLAMSRRYDIVTEIKPNNRKVR